MKYRVGRDGQEIGVWTLEEIIALYQRGELRSGDFVWKEGMPAWKTLAEILPASPPPMTGDAAPALPDLPSLPDIAAIPEINNPAQAGESGDEPGATPLTLRPRPATGHGSHVRPPVAGASAGQTSRRPPKPANNLVWAILVTLFCCIPFGIPAIIFATQVDSKYASGDYAGAEDAARKAKMWAWISAGVGLVVGALWSLFAVVGGGLSGLGRF
ncbi:membrane protein [Opitutaceae bacterium TAV5]|nr:membrane protein [Opitutaceae bacterium TAV5]